MAQSQIAYLRLVPEEEAVLWRKTERLRKEIEQTKMFEQIRKEVEEKIRQMNLENKIGSKLIEILEKLKTNDLRKTQQELQKAEKELWEYRKRHRLL